MTALSKKARLIITFPTGPVEVFPATDDYKFDYLKDDDFGYYRKVMSQKLLFCKDEFKLFLSHEISCERCEPLPFQLITVCSGQESIELSGAFYVSDGAFNESKCEVLINARIEDDYTCYDENKDEEINILAGTQKVTVSTLIGQAVFSPICFASGVPDATTYIDNCITGVGWNVVEHNFTVPDLAFTSWVREEYSGGGVPPGTGWILEGSIWVRPINMRFVSYISNTSNTQELYEPIDYVIDNGVPFLEMFDKLLEECGLTLVSDFYNVNQDNTHPVNVAYNYAEEHLQDLVFFQQTDITNYDAFQNATIAETTLFEILKDLQSLHNVGIIIEGNALRLEHVSYFQAQQGIDLTTFAPNAIKGLKAWSYIAEKLPKSEDWEFSEQQSSAFSGTNISYIDCYTKGLKETRTLRKLLTDFPFFAGNTEAGNSGIIIIETVQFNGTRSIISNNEGQRLSNLLPNLWLHDRPQWNGKIGGQDYEFESVIKTKQQVALQATICCSDLNSFAPIDLVKSQIGWGQIEAASYSFKDRCLDFILVHEVEKCDSCNLVAIATNETRNATVEVIGDCTNPSYQWQILLNNIWVSPVQSNSQDYRIRRFGSYRVIVTCDECEVISNVINYSN